MKTDYDEEMIEALSQHHGKKKKKELTASP
jgi:hypothetical protein